ncbi:MAG: prolyl oligopeptidase family serine peptidase [Candidatus Latescibacteria bacterium]|nr:prolyl oligopeptidase family serine peptidase [Candidatus Latescibacterota bacterium]
MNEQPRAPMRDKTLEEHGESRSDPYFWLRDIDDPATMAYLESENTYTEATLAPTRDLQEQLYSEMRGRIQEADASVPEKDGEYYYYTRYDEGAQYPVYCRKQGGLEAAEEVLLDVEALAADQDYCRIGVCVASPDHRYLAYSVDLDGSEKYTLYLLDIEAGDLLPERIEGTYYSAVWANDSQTLFYDVLDANHRPVEIRRHRLGQPAETDPTVYKEEDEGFFIGLTKSASQRFIYLQASGNNRSEWRFLDADAPQGNWQLVAPRRPDFEYEVEDLADRFLIRHNGDGARDFKISEAPLEAPGEEHWRDYIDHEAGRPLLGLRPFRDFLAVGYRRQGLSQIMVVELASGQRHEIDFDEEAYAVGLRGNREWATATLRFSYMSMTTPESVYDYDMSGRQRQLRKRKAVLGGFDPTQYQTRRLWAKARDGAQVPISLVMRRDTPVDGTAPLYLYGYGSYGASMSADFQANRLSLLDRGFVCAVAHIRGGMEMGWDWYEQGKLLHKKNTFNDFIDCAEHLVESGYTSRGRIAAVGGSAGGLLVGAVANQRPDLFKAVIAHVPFVDVVNTMFDDTLPLTTIEYNEWGNPNRPDYYRYIRSYSPYDNVRAQEYPHMLIIGGLSDPRVTYWEPAKWAARLRQLKTDQRLVLLKTHMESGHAGASGRFDYLREVALDYAFLVHVFGLEGMVE